MENRGAFSGFHPVNNLLFFAIVLAVAMTVRHPVYVGITLLSGIVALRIPPGGRGGGLLPMLLPMALLAALINPAFNHRGVTILFYLPSGNPVTLESILYGLGAAGMLSGVVVWFAFWCRMMTADKLVYLFGRVVPALSLVLSVTLRFVPLFVCRLRQARDAQQGLYPAEKGRLAPLRRGIRVFSALITWGMEQAIETADSMRARGYGLPGRRAYTLYRFDRRDRYMLAWLVFCGLFLAAGALAGAMQWEYYPVVTGTPLGGVSGLFPLCYLALCLTPPGAELWYERRWRQAHGDA